MRRLLRRLEAGVCLVLALALTGAEVWLAWSWLRGTLYVMRAGAAENPYAAEDADIAGLCALLLLPLGIIAWAMYKVVSPVEKEGVSPSGEIEAKRHADDIL